MRVGVSAPLGDPGRACEGQAVVDYDRSTTSTSLARLPEPLQGAIADRIESAALTVPADTAAFLTLSKRLRKPGLLSRLTGAGDKDLEHMTVLVVGPKDVLVGVHGEQRGTSVLTARLEDVEITPLDEPLRRSGDDGVSITGFPVSIEAASGRGSFFVGLGPPAGEDAKAALDAAIRTAKA
jgi:hypothetical protein